MRRLSSFLMGMVVGAGLLYGALHYHLVQASDGWHVIAKTDSELAGTYVDIRTFTFADWANHPKLAAALMRADRADLVENAAAGALNNGIDRLLGGDRNQPQ